MSDVSVYGLTMGQCFIEDIGVLVPHGVVVNVPAEQAYCSKDLWRAINQRKVFQLKAGPGSPLPYREPVVPQVIEPGQLLQSLSEQREQNAALMAALLDQHKAIQRLTDTIASMRATQVRCDMAQEVDGTVPSFIPSTVKPDVTEQRIQEKAEESGNTGVANARNRLRAIRKAR